MEASSTQVSVLLVSAQTTIPSGAPLRNAAPWGFERDKRSSFARSSTTIKVHGLMLLPEGDRKAASMSCSIFSGSTGRSSYFRILRLLSKTFKNIMTSYSLYCPAGEKNHPVAPILFLYMALLEIKPVYILRKAALLMVLIIGLKAFGI
jgi:hypothetical protein